MSSSRPKHMRKGGVASVLFGSALSRVLTFMGCLIISVALVALFFGVGLDVETDDDITIALALSGNYGPGGNCLHLSSALACLIWQLGLIAPSINWFTVFELATTALAIAVLLYVVLKECGLGFALFALFFVAKCVLPSCTYASNYTAVSALCGGAGFAALMSWTKSYLAGGKVRRGLGLAVVGLVLVAFSYCWRTKCFLICIPFACLITLALLLANAKKSNEAGKGFTETMRRMAVPVIATVAMCGCLYAFNAFMWSQPEWKSWSEYEVVRSTLSDYPVKEYEQVADELAAAGFTEIDYRMVTAWGTNDPEVFTNERLATMVDIIADRTSGGSLDTFLHRLIAYTKEFRTIYLIWLLLCLFAFLGILTGDADKRRKALSTLLLIATVCAVGVVAAYFAFAGRYPLRVCVSLLVISLPAIACAVSLARKAHRLKVEFASRGLAIVSGVLGVGLLSWTLVGIVPHFDRSNFGALENPGAIEVKGPLYEEVSRGDEVFVWDTIEYYDVEYGMYRCRFLCTAEFQKHNLSLGGWTSTAPFRKAIEAEMGMPNVYRGLLENDKARLITKDMALAEKVRLYLAAHYEPNTTFTVERTIEDEGRVFNVIKFAK